MIIPELPDHLRSMGGKNNIGLIIPIFAFAALVSRPISGKLTDTVGRVPVMIIGTVVCFALGLLYPMVHTVTIFFVLRFLHGFSTGFKPTGTSAYLADIVPIMRRGEAMGVIGAFGSTGMALGPYIGSEIKIQYSLDATFYASSAFAICSILILARMKETLKDRKSFSWDLLVPKRTELFEPLVIAPTIVMTLTVVSFGAILTIMPDFTAHLGIANKGTYFLVFTLSSIAVRLLAGKVSDKVGRVAVLRVSVLMIFLAMLMLAYTETKTMFYIGGVLFGLAAGMNSPTVFAWTIDLSDKKFSGRAMSTMYMGLEIGIIAGGLISGYTYNNNPENFPTTFLICGLGCIPAFLYLIFGLKKREKV